MEHLQVGSIGNSGKLHPGKFCKIVLQPLEIPRPRIKTYGNSTWFLLDHPWKFHFLLNWPLEFLHALSSVLSWKFNVLNSRPMFNSVWQGIIRQFQKHLSFDFLWNSPIIRCYTGSRTRQATKIWIIFTEATEGEVKLIKPIKSNDMYFGQTAVLVNLQTKWILKIGLKCT